MAELPNCTCAPPQAHMCELHDPAGDLFEALRDLLSVVSDKEFRFAEDQAIIARARAALKAAGG